jgi:hypothetical protein
LTEIAKSDNGHIEALAVLTVDPSPVADSDDAESSVPATELPLPYPLT